jgi:hypothetical protein
MAKTHDLKRRIRSIKNTMQVTKAMKMVSAARLRRAQDRILAARPFAVTTGRSWPPRRARIPSCIRCWSNATSRGSSWSS